MLLVTQNSAAVAGGSFSTELFYGACALLPIIALLNFSKTAGILCEMLVPVAATGDAPCAICFKSSHV